MDVMANRERMLMKKMGKAKPKSPAVSAPPMKDKSKKNRVWDGILDNGKRSANQVSELDFSGNAKAAGEVSAHCGSNQPRIQTKVLGH